MEQLKPHVTESFMEDFLEGESYIVSPEQVEEFVESMPMMDVPTNVTGLRHEPPEFFQNCCSFGGIGQ